MMMNEGTNMANTVEVSVDDLTRTLMLLDAAQEALDAAANVFIVQVKALALIGLDHTQQPEKE